MFSEKKWVLVEERYADQRLRRLFSKVPENPKFFFTTQGDLAGKSLVMSFDNGPEQDSDFANEVLGRLFIDSATSTLCLGIWPLPKPEKDMSDKSKTYVLLDEVEGLSFSFYHPPELDKKPVDPEEVKGMNPRDGDNEEWRKEYAQLPAIVKVELTRKENSSFKERDLMFVYEFPRRIIYLKKEGEK